MKLASNLEDALMLELLHAVATGFLRKRRQEEFNATQAASAAAAAAKAAEEAAKAEPQEPITGEVVTAPMGGTIMEIRVTPGQTVKKGQVILVYEAMKMENEVEAERDAVIKRIFVKPGEVVGLEANLIEFAD